MGLLIQVIIIFLKSGQSYQLTSWLSQPQTQEMLVNYNNHQNVTIQLLYSQAVIVYLNLLSSRHLYGPLINVVFKHFNWSIPTNYCIKDEFDMIMQLGSISILNKTVRLVQFFMV